MNPDRLRTQPKAVGFVRAFFDAGKPVAVICHGPWTIIEAGVAAGRRITSGLRSKPIFAMPVRSGLTKKQ